MDIELTNLTMDLLLKRRMNAMLRMIEITTHSIKYLNNILLRKFFSKCLQKSSISRSIPIIPAEESKEYYSRMEVL